MLGWLFRGEAGDFGERFEQDRLSRAGRDQMAGWYRLPELALHVERLRHHDDAVAGLAVVQRVRRAAIGVAEGEEIPESLFRPTPQLPPDKLY